MREGSLDILEFTHTVIHGPLGNSKMLDFQPPRRDAGMKGVFAVKPGWLAGMHHVLYSLATSTCPSSFFYGDILRLAFVYSMGGTEIWKVVRHVCRVLAFCACATTIGRFAQRVWSRLIVLCRAGLYYVTKKCSGVAHG